MFGPRNSYVHPSIVLEEAETLGAHCRDDDDVFLTALVCIDSVHLNVSIALKAQLVSDFGQNRFYLPDL